MPRKNRFIFYALPAPVIIFVCLLFVGFFDDTYTQLCPNKNESHMAYREFQWACDDEFDYEEWNRGFECCKYYDTKSESTNKFKSLTRNLNNLYTNSLFFHCYVSDNKRTYICCDKDRKRMVATWEKIDFYTYQKYKISLVVETL